MTVHVRLSAGLAQVAGAARLVVTLPEEATVGDLLERVCAEHPALASRLEMALPVVSGRHAARSERLVAGQEVAFLLPVAGGSR